MYTSSEELVLSSINGDFIAKFESDLEITSVCFMNTDETLLGTYVITGHVSGTFRLLKLVWNNGWKFDVLHIHTDSLALRITALTATP